MKTPFYNLRRLQGFLSIDVDVSELYINQCDIYYATNYGDKKIIINQGMELDNSLPHYHNLEQKFYTQLRIQYQNQLDNQIQIDVFHGSHKCHRDSMEVYL